MTSDEIAAHAERRVPGFVAAGAPEPLSGGLLNEVWRIEGTPRALIVKHAPPFIASAPEVPLASERIAFEARALFDLAPGGRLAGVADDRARAPYPLDFDDVRHVLVMEDLGQAPDVFEAVRGGADAAALGSELGAFIGRLHGVSYGRDDLARGYSNRGIQRTRLDVQYRSVDAWLTAHGVGASEAAACAVRTRWLGERLLDPGMCLVMGDLWPPSVRVAAGAIRVIDWEFAHYGQPLQDIAHFAAHAFLHACEPASDAERTRLVALWRAFALAYEGCAGTVHERALAPDAWRDFATHAAAEILVRSVGPFARGWPAEGQARDRWMHGVVSTALRLLHGDSPRPDLAGWIDALTIARDERGDHDATQR